MLEAGSSASVRWSTLHVLAVKEQMRTVDDNPAAPPVKLEAPLRFVQRAEVLPQQPFLGWLRLEKRRCDRSQAPMSLLIVDVDIDGQDGIRTHRELIDRISGIKRETDLLGYLGDDRIAVLLLDTAAEGAQAFCRRLAVAAADVAYKVTTGTYPDKLFESLLGALDDQVASLLMDVGPSRDPIGSVAKRLVDFFGSLAALIAASPVMLVAAMAVKLSSPGPVIFRQQRVGKGGVPFTFYKFRSMHAGSDDRVHREYVAQLIEGNVDAVNQGDGQQPHFKIKGDRRVTAVGRFIRRTSIDELPQLYNVLKGDMSLVGPRPPLPYEAEQYKSWHLRRVLETRPGITGLWQVEGRNRTTFDEMVRLDLRYIREWSPMLDFRILLKTVAVVLGGKGDA